MDRTKPLLTEAEALRHYAADLELRADERGGRRGLRAMRTSLRHYAAGRFDEPDDPVLVWADLHIGHRNIIRYTNRPFRDRNDMDRTLWARMYEAADPDTTLVVVGDMLMGQAVA